MRLSRILFVLLLLQVPFVLVAVIGIESRSEDVEPWLPRESAERDVYNAFVERFDIDDMVLVTWEGCTLDDKRLDLLARLIRNRMVADDSQHASPPLARRVITGRSILEDLTTAPISVSREAALQRMKGLFVGQDGRTTCALIEVSEHGRRDRRQLISQVTRICVDDVGIQESDLKLAGNAFVGVCVDKETMRTFRVMGMLSLLISAIIAYAALKSVRLALVAMAAGSHASGLAVALIYFNNDYMSGILVSLPTLALVLTLAGAIHLINYFHDARQHMSPAKAAVEAFHMGRVPCVLASVTTAIGMLSLGVSKIPSVASYGFYCAVAIMCGLVVLLVIVPVMLSFPWFHVGLPRRQDTSAVGAPLPEVQFADWILRHRTLLFLLSFTVFLLAVPGLGRLRTSLNLEEFFADNTELSRNLDWVESSIGPVAPTEIVLDFDSDSTSRFVNRLDIVRAVQGKLLELPETGGIFSAATLLPDAPGGSGFGRAMKLVAFEKVLQDNREKLIADGYIAESGTHEFWRISVRLDALGSDRQELTRLVETTAKNAAQAEDATVAITCTGISTLFYGAQEQLLTDLKFSFVLAFALITPVMMLILRSIRAGLLAMLPNAFPAVFIFGLLGWTGFPVDLGIMVTASVALGIAVDDTLHFLTWFGRAVRSGQDRDDAIRTTFRMCSRAMLQTSLVCGIGLLAFVLSPFLPARRFGWLMCAMLAAALTGDLIMLPTLLSSRFGNIFMGAGKRAKNLTSAVLVSGPPIEETP